MGKRTELGLAQRVEAVLALMRREEPAAGIARRFGVAVWLFPNTLQQLWFMIWSFRYGYNATKKKAKKGF